MNKGQRVEIVDGILQGEKATIVPFPGTEDEWKDGDFVWIRFDRDGAYLPERGHAILSQQWYEVDRLRVIE